MESFLFASKTNRTNLLYTWHPVLAIIRRKKIVWIIGNDAVLHSLSGESNKFVYKERKRGGGKWGERKTTGADVYSHASNGFRDKIRPTLSLTWTGRRAYCVAVVTLGLNRRKPLLSWLCREDRYDIEERTVQFHDAHNKQMTNMPNAALEPLQWERDKRRRYDE